MSPIIPSLGAVKAGASITFDGPHGKTTGTIINPSIKVNNGAMTTDAQAATHVQVQLEDGIAYVPVGIAPAAVALAATEAAQVAVTE